MFSRMQDTERIELILFDDIVPPCSYLQRALGIW